MHLGACCLFHCRLPTPVLTGSGYEGLSQPRRCPILAACAAPLSMGWNLMVREGGRGNCNGTGGRRQLCRRLAPGNCNPTLLLAFKARAVACASKATSDVPTS